VEEKHIKPETETNKQINNNNNNSILVYVSANNNGNNYSILQKHLNRTFLAPNTSTSLQTILIIIIILIIITIIIIQSLLSRNITPCSPLKVNRRFGGTSSLYLQGKNISQTRKQHGEGNKRSLVPPKHRLSLNVLHGVHLFVTNKYG
jgi:hypothetical protein